MIDTNDFKRQQESKLWIQEPWDVKEIREIILSREELME